MVRAPTIRGRPTPARKHKTSLSSSSSLPTTISSAKTAVPKALKRAEKRAQLLVKASNSENKGARALLKDDEQSISKSSIRRRKRKARDEIGKDIDQGRQGGVKDMMDVVDQLETEIETDDREESNQDYKKGGLQDSGKVTANQRRRLLVQEQARQSVVLSNPAYKVSPFEALRLHARNTMAATGR